MTRLLHRLWLLYWIANDESWQRALEREGIDSTEVRKSINAQHCALAATWS